VGVGGENRRGGGCYRENAERRRAAGNGRKGSLFSPGKGGLPDETIGTSQVDAGPTCQMIHSEVGALNWEERPCARDSGSKGKTRNICDKTKTKRLPAKGQVTRGGKARVEVTNENAALRGGRIKKSAWGRAL